ncbi:RcpC/CpaB family pilus assembly protein [Streptomyces sp. MAR4 CNX-425]|uniref:RcpC/CpaB family pilus assembly protein n=1 Tax=Streptomyces sp. MAR4 CNX-425 TaxID=3406343 RepID=UPI003B502629
MPRGAPPPRPVPEFEPLRPPRGARLRRAVARRSRLLAAVVAMTAAALAAAPRSDAESPPPATAPDGSATGVPGEAPGATAGEHVGGGGGGAGAGGGEVLAPVRLADAGVAGLLEPGDVVDVLAVGAEDTGGGGPARIVARAARVAEIPGTAEAPGAPGFAADPEAQPPPGATGLTAPAGGDGGTLVVLSVPRKTAAALAGAAAERRLAVTLR